jgi:hypothetical protein
MSRNLGALTLLDPSEPAWPVMGVLYLFYGKESRFIRALREYLKTRNAYVGWCV